MTETFRAMIVRKEQEVFQRSIQMRSIEDLPAGEVLVRVRYAALNYKDALTATGRRGLTRRYPHTPGIEAAGTVVSCSTDDFAPDEEVFVAGGEFGVNIDGAYAQYVRVGASFVRRCDPLTLREAVTSGVAGFTAAICLHKLQLNGLTPADGPVLVTGATGGVGSLAVAILAKAQYEVTAVTGKPDKVEFLKQLGAETILARDEFEDTGDRPLLPERWAGVVDTVGGGILATAIKGTKYGGSVTACGLVQSPELRTTVYPFILRGVNLLGVDSVKCPEDLRDKLWHRLSGDWKPDNLDTIASVCSLDQLSEKIDLMLEGRVSGRTIVDLDL